MGVNEKDHSLLIMNYDSALTESFELPTPNNRMELGMYKPSGLGVMIIHPSPMKTAYRHHRVEEIIRLRRILIGHHRRFSFRSNRF